MFSLFSVVTLAQDQPKTHQLPSLTDLPRTNEVKTFYEFDKVYAYEIYDEEDEFIQKGKTQFVDVTEFPTGIYFIYYDGKKVRYEVKEE